MLRQRPPVPFRDPVFHARSRLRPPVQPPPARPRSSEGRPRVLPVRPQAAAHHRPPPPAHPPDSTAAAGRRARTDRPPGAVAAAPQPLWPECRHASARSLRPARSGVPDHARAPQRPAAPTARVRAAAAPDRSPAPSRPARRPPAPCRAPATEEARHAPCVPGAPPVPRSRTRRRHAPPAARRAPARVSPVAAPRRTAPPDSPRTARSAACRSHHRPPAAPARRSPATTPAYLHCAPGPRTRPPLWKTQAPSPKARRSPACTGLSPGRPATNLP